MFRVPTLWITDPNRETRYPEKGVGEHPFLFFGPADAGTTMNSFPLRGYKKKL